MSPPTRFPELPAAPASLKAELLITTPMFQGDGGQKASSIRPPSIKGALRFWWRALQWPRLYQRYGHLGAALTDLHTQEAELFGLAAGHKGAGSDDDKNAETVGQGRFRISITQPDVKADPDYRPAASVQYLLGQGLYHFRDGVLRQPLRQGSRFTLELTAKPSGHTVTDKQWKSLEEALLCWGLLGGLGARARKGLGSVSLQSLEGGAYQAPQNRADYEALLSKLLAPLQGQDGQLPPFTAFSSVSRVETVLQDSNSTNVLSMLGEQFQLYRSFGKDGTINGRPSGTEAEKNFKADHDLIRDAIERGKLSSAPKRAVFGLPHSYFFSSLNNQKLKVSAAYGDRRASPLFMHVHEFCNGKCLGVLSLLPADFLPSENNELAITESVRTKFALMNKDLDWNVIHGFFERDKFKEKSTVLKALNTTPQEAQG